MEKDILQTILAAKKEEVARQKQVITETQLQQQLSDRMQMHSLAQSLLNSPTGIIAEFKRRSPSKGWINREADVAQVVQAYEQAGAAGLSVLTDEAFFGGSLKDLRIARQAAQLPVLRKDFVVDEYQLYQARVLQADVVLLIAAALTPLRCRQLACLAHELQLEVLLEVHREEELDCLNEYVDLIGVNNRNLGSFHTDVENSFRMARVLPASLPWVSESGIASAAVVRSLREAGFRGFLMGEAFMKTNNPGNALSDFIKPLNL